MFPKGLITLVVTVYVKCSLSFLPFIFVQNACLVPVEGYIHRKEK